jgi:hypothetical protein
MTGRFERFDARPGGSYRLVLTYSDASGAPGKATAESDIVEARFVDIVPGERVVQAVDFVSTTPRCASLDYDLASPPPTRRASTSWPKTFRTAFPRGPRRGPGLVPDEPAAYVELGVP